MKKWEMKIDLGALPNDMEKGGEEEAFIWINGNLHFPRPECVVSLESCTSDTKS